MVARRRVAKPKSAKQIAASKRNLIKARAARSRGGSSSSSGTSSTPAQFKAKFLGYHQHSTGTISRVYTSPHPGNVTLTGTWGTGLFTKEELARGTYGQRAANGLSITSGGGTRKRRRTKKK